MDFLFGIVLFFVSLYTVIAQPRFTSPLQTTTWSGNTAQAITWSGLETFTSKWDVHLYLRDSNGRKADLGVVNVASGYQSIQIPGSLESGAYKLILDEKCPDSDDKSRLFPIQSETFTIEQSNIDPISSIPSIEFEKPKEKKKPLIEEKDSMAHDANLDDATGDMISCHNSINVFASSIFIAVIWNLL